MTQIHKDVAVGNTESVIRHLAQGVAVDLRDSTGRTPLMIAVTSDEAEVGIVRLLIEHGADVNASAVVRDKESTVLALAVGESSLDKIELLLQSGADVHYKSPAGYDVMIDAMYSKARVNKEPLLPLVEMLLTHGAPTQGESNYGESALSVSSHVGRFEVVGRLLEAGADAQILEWSELMYAVALGSTTELERLLIKGADLSARDSWNRTPWLLSVQSGNLEKAQLLLSAGANFGDLGHCDRTALMYAIENEWGEMLSWLIEQGADIEAKDKFGTTPLIMAAEQGATECVRRLLDAGARVATRNLPDAPDWNKEAMALLEELDPDTKESIDGGVIDFSHLPGEPAIKKASNIEIVRLLVAAGADLADINDEVRAQLTGLEHGGEISCTHSDYTMGKDPRFGTSNPEVMDIAFWKAMVRSGASAYTARETFGDTDNLYEGPVWCFSRYGKSITELPDGRVIEIGGEHEDHYDPDFCIYNDVFVHHGGGHFDILGYPEAVFPPIDFHSATLAGDFLYIIGCLGYPEARRMGHTPVYRLHCGTLAIEAVKTTGDKPGWISEHKAVYRPSSSGHGEICISGGRIIKRVKWKKDYAENSDSYVLNLESMRWRRVGR